jgi:hypothetical protein
MFALRIGGKLVKDTKKPTNNGKGKNIGRFVLHAAIFDHTDQIALSPSNIARALGSTGYLGNFGHIGNFRTRIEEGVQGMQRGQKAKTRDPALEIQPSRAIVTSQP